MSDGYSVSLWSRSLVIKAHSGRVACFVNKGGAFEFVQLLLIPKPGGFGFISWWEEKVENPHLEQRKVCGAAVNSLTPSSTAHPSPHVVRSQKQEHFFNYIFTKRATNNQDCFCNLIFTKQKEKQGIYLLAHMLTENQGTSVHTDQEQLCRFLHKN